MEHHLPRPEDLLPMLSLLLDHLRHKPIGTTASGSFVTVEDAQRLSRGDRAITGGVCIIVTTDPEAIAKDLARAREAAKRGDATAISLKEEGNHG